MGSRCALLRPGLVAYHHGLALQQRIAETVRAGGDEALILLEHPPVYTLGVRGKQDNLLLSIDAFRARGADVVRTDRGGDVTFHGPGQIVGYPIMNVRERNMGAATYVRAIEQVIIDALAAFRIDAGRIGGRPGVWTRGAKVAAIGVRVSRGVTTHGFALNVSTDLSFFEHIVPCGIVDATVTSMKRELGRAPATADVQVALASAFASAFAVTVVDRCSAVGPLFPSPDTRRQPRAIEGEMRHAEARVGR